MMANEKDQTQLKNKGGRPAIIIQQESFEHLCELQCTLMEIAAFFNCSHDTIERWCKKTYKKNFEDVFKIKRGKGLISLRRNQFALSKKNASMAIWLGKQYLDQKDQVETYNTFEDLKPLGEMLSLEDDSKTDD